MNGAQVSGKRWWGEAAAARALTFCALLIFSSAPAGGAEEAETAPWQLTADRLTRIQQPETLVAEGDVVLSHRQSEAAPLLIESDWMQYDVEPGVASARGNVTIHSMDYLIEADEVRLVLEPQTGILSDATILVPREEYTLYISGREIEKTGELTYRLREGTITSCPLDPDRSRPWVLKSREVRIRKDGMGVLRHATLSIKDTPVLYTPYLIFPAKTERQSGFLLPELSNSSRGGYGLVVPYFLDLSPSRDITFYPGYYQDRGPVAGLEGRYVADPRSRGTVQASYLRDRTVDTPEDDFLEDGFLRTLQDRYWLRGKMDHYFSDSLVSRLDFDVVSDRDYLQEFRGGLLGFDDTNRQFLDSHHRGLQAETDFRRNSNLQVVKSWGGMLATGELQWVRDISWRGAEGVQPPEVTPAQTLPRLGVSGRTPLYATPLSVAWDTEYIHYWREEGRGYQRLNLFPRLTMAIPRWVLEGRLAAGVRQTSWLLRGAEDWPDDRTQHRTMGSFESEIGTSLVRDFDLELGAIRTLSHAVRPAISYEYIQEVDQPLGVGQPLEDWFIDEVDRIDPRSWLTYGLSNHFNAEEFLGGEGLASRYLGYFRINQTYDLREERRELASPDDRRRPFSDVLFEVDLRPLSRLRLNYENSLSIYGQGVTYYKILTSFADGRGNNLFVDYSYQRDPQASRPFFFIRRPTDSERKLTLALLSQLTATISVQADHTEIWRTETQRPEDDQSFKEINQAVRLFYRPTCWAVELSAERTTDDLRFAVVFSLTGLGDLMGIGLGRNNYLSYRLF